MSDQFKILTLNNISVAGLDRLPRDRYEVASEIEHPDGILLRSASLHDLAVPDSLKAIGRAGAGVNNIPVAQMSQAGIAVFNAPGANANAVKELVLAGLFLAARNICGAWAYARALDGDAETMRRAMEQDKKRFVGFELPGRTLGVIGLGAIGVEVANAALALGMRVVGYDPGMTVSRAWQLSAEVGQANSVGELLRAADMVTLHVPFAPETSGLIDAERISVMREGVTLLNFSRAGIVDEEAVASALTRGAMHAYVCDFPSLRLRGLDNVIALPHIGASTREAEDNCAVMVAEQLKEYLENGNIRNSVNFPDVSMPRNGGYRVAVANRNVPNMLGQISTTLAAHDLNILDMLNKSRGDLAYTLLDAEQVVREDVLAKLREIEGVLAVRAV